MLIYANGDSFTAGDELTLDKLPDYPGNLSSRIIDNPKYNRWLEELRESNPSLVQHVISMQDTRAYPAELGKLLKCGVINKAIGGSSNDRIVRTSIHDLLLLKKIEPDIVALIGFSAPGCREELPMPGDEWIQVQLINSFNITDLLQGYQTYKLTVESDYHKYSFLYRNIIQMQNFCKTLNIPVIFVSSGYSFEANYKLLDKHEDLKLYYEHITATTYSLLNAAIKIDKPYSIFGHYSKDVHVEAANQLLDLVKR